MKTIHGIYVPGLGDENRPKEAKLSAFWQVIHGIDLQYHPVMWSKGKEFMPKLDDLLAHIDRLHKEHGKVALVGTSAGASAVINAYAKRPDKVRAVVVICGKIQHPEAIGPVFHQGFPAFIKSMDILADGLRSLDPKQLAKILTRIPIHDEVVPVKDMRVSGAKHQLQLTIFHAPSIALGMTLASRPSARFIRRQPS